MIDISVIIPTYNRRDELPIALHSVFNQTGIHVECIVVDDGSSDGTVEFIRKHFMDKELVVIEKPVRSGPQVSRNLGIGAARGEFVTFLDSDDYFEPDTLAKRVQCCRDNNLDALFSGYRVKFIGRSWSLIKDVNTNFRSCPSDYASALRNFKIAPMITIMYRRIAHVTLQLDESLLSGHDDDLSLHLIRTSRYDFDNILSATIIHHVGERVATPRNLMVGDAQLLQKYTEDIVRLHGLPYLTKRRAYALAGLWSVAQFKRSALLHPCESSHGLMTATLLCGMIYLPLRMMISLRKRLLMITVRVVL